MHISQLANRYIKNPYDVVAVGDVVTVWVLAVDHDRRRVSLTMIQPGTERKPPEKRPQQQQQQQRGNRPPRGRWPQPAKGQDVAVPGQAQGTPREGAGSARCRHVGAPTRASTSQAAARTASTEAVEGCARGGGAIADLQRAEGFFRGSKTRRRSKRLLGRAWRRTGALSQVVSRTCVRALLPLAPTRPLSIQAAPSRRCTSACPRRSIEPGVWHLPPLEVQPCRRPSQPEPAPRTSAATVGLYQRQRRQERSHGVAELAASAARPHRKDDSRGAYISGIECVAAVEAAAHRPG